MNLNGLSRHYSAFTPEERFVLILQASARDDDAERGRLMQSAPRVQYTSPEHVPYSHAMGELANFTLLELLEAASMCRDAEEVAWAEEQARGKDQQRCRDMVEGWRWLLRMKYEGWSLFCQKLGVPSGL